MIGDQRTALFIVISDTDDTFNFVVAMMYSQLFNLLCDRADDVHHGRLPYQDRKSTRLNSSHGIGSRMPSSA